MTTTNLTNPIIEEIQKCKNDKVHFIENYIKVPSYDDAGITSFVLRDEHKEIVLALANHQIVEKDVDRAWGKTVLAAALIVHDLVFSVNKTIVVVMREIALTSEVRSIIEFMIDQLPDMMKPVWTVHNKRNLETTSGVRIWFDGSQANSLRGRGVSFLYIENFSRFSARDQEEFHYRFAPMMASKFGTRMLVLNS